MECRKMIVATDGSTSANNAVAAAGDLASRLGSEVVVVHVVPDPGEFRIPEELRDLERSEHMNVTEYDLVMATARDLLESAAEQLRARGVTKVETRIEVGDPATQLIDVARRGKADLIIMGRRGVGRLGGLLFGSVTFKVAQVSSLPCMTVP